jgi:hypothetical protein
MLQPREVGAWEKRIGGTDAGKPPLLKHFEIFGRLSARAMDCAAGPRGGAAAAGGGQHRIIQHGLVGLLPSVSSEMHL